MSDENDSIRYRAAEALGNIGRVSDEIVPSLLSALDDDAAYVRAHAALALGKMGSDDEIIEALIKALDDENKSVRSFSCSALGHIGPEASSALPKLRDIAENDPYRDERHNGEYSVRMAATYAIYRIEEES